MASIVIECQSCNGRTTIEKELSGTKTNTAKEYVKHTMFDHCKACGKNHWDFFAIIGFRNDSEKSTERDW